MKISTKFGPPAEKRDLTTFCNMLSNTNSKSVKNNYFILSFKEGSFMHNGISYLLTVNCAVILSKTRASVAMATVLLRQPIFIKCWSCHRNKTPWQQNPFHLKG